MFRNHSISFPQRAPLRPGRRVTLLLAFLLAAALIVAPGCSNQKRDTEQSASQDPSRAHGGLSGQKGGDRPVPDGKQTNGETVGPRTGPRERSAAVNRETPEIEEKRAEKGETVARVENLSGYKVLAEYFMVPSKYIDDPVAAVALPDDYHEHPDKRYPLVLLFGGAGECARPPRDGALAWLDYYSADEAILALHSSELKPSDFRDLATEKELEYFNRKLKKNPYRGLLLVCPASPPLTIASGVEHEGYEKYIMEELLPSLKSRYRVDNAAIGVDGVSMGGARSMYYGFKWPEQFMSIGSIQAAVGPFMDVYRDLVAKNGAILKKRSIQLVTSDDDPMAGSVKRFKRMLDKNGIPARFLDLKGPHDYIFNQGPGAIALLMFHDSALWRLKPGPTR